MKTIDKSKNIEKKSQKVKPAQRSGRPPAFNRNLKTAISSGQKRDWAEKLHTHPQSLGIAPKFKFFYCFFSLIYFK
jgi:hypothetical protein